MNSFRHVTWFNRIALLILAAASVLMFARGEWWMGSSIVVAIPIMAFMIVRSKRGKGGDLDRVSAAQPYDERDQRTITAGFALFGQAVLLGQLAVFLWAAATRSDALGSEAVRLLILSVAMIVANIVATRRS